MRGKRISWDCLRVQLWLFAFGSSPLGRGMLFELPKTQTGTCASRGVELCKGLLEAIAMVDEA